MDKTRRMIRNQKHHSASTEKRLKTFSKGFSSPWPDLNHDVLCLVMMQLGVVDFISFSGVCKSWRSFALCNRNRFMATKQPMPMTISSRAYKDDCYLEDFEGRKFKTCLSHSARRMCVGLTCGYLIFFSWKHEDHFEGIKFKTSDFWLVNPITRHELHFPCHPSLQASDVSTSIRSILVFSPSISGWVLVTSRRFTNEIWFSVASKGAWNHVYSTFPILDLHAFKGKIYTLHTCSDIREVRHICEMSFNPEPKLAILETKNFPNSCNVQEFVSSGENLFVVPLIPEKECMIHGLDFDEMKWFSHEKKNEEYAFFLSLFKSSAAVKTLSRADPFSGRFVETLASGKVRLFRKNMWYFPHDCFNVNSLEV